MLKIWVRHELDFQETGMWMHMRTQIHDRQFQKYGDMAQKINWDTIKLQNE